MKFLLRTGMEETEVEATEVILCGPDGQEVSLSYSSTEREIRLSTAWHQLFILPRAANVVWVREAR